MEDQPTVVSSADGAKVRRKSETTKDLAKKNCLLSYHSALIAGASVKAAHGAALLSELSSTEEPGCSELLRPAVCSFRTIASVLRRMESCFPVIVGSCAFLRPIQTYRSTRIHLFSFSNIRQWLFHPLFQGCPAVPKYPELLLPLAGCKDTKKNWYYVNFHLIFRQVRLDIASTFD